MKTSYRTKIAIAHGSSIIRSAFYGVGRSVNPNAGLFEGYNFTALHRFA